VSNADFEYGPVARGIFIAMIWLVVLIALTTPFLLVIYLPFLIFLGLGLKPFLISTGLARQYQAFSAKRSDRINEQLRQGSYTRNGQKMDARDKHLEVMRKKMMPKE